MEVRETTHVGEGVQKMEGYHTGNDPTLVRNPVLAGPAPQRASNQTQPCRSTDGSQQLTGVVGKHGSSVGAKPVDHAGV